jgi:hypothetical protein
LTMRHFQLVSGAISQLPENSRPSPRPFPPSSRISLRPPWRGPAQIHPETTPATMDRPPFRAMIASSRPRRNPCAGRLRSRPWRADPPLYRRQPP